MKVLFLTSIPIIKQHRIDMYIDAIAEFYDVELWDLSLLYGCNVSMAGMENECVRVLNMTDFDDRLSKLKDSKVIIITNILIHNLKIIYPILQKNNIPIVNINKDSFPAWLQDKSAAKSFFNMRFLPYMKALVRNYGLSRRLYKLIAVGPVVYDYQLASYNFYPEDSRNFVKIHNVKFDEFSAAKEQKSIIAGDYILFVDAALADHPMFLGSERKINRELYLRKLNNYFSQLEEKYHLDVVISAHPKSNYSKEDFMGRKIYLYNTPILIQHAHYIVSHYSTSLFDAILCQKPFKVLYSKDLLNSICYGTVRSGMQLANMLNAECVNLDNPTLNDFTLSKSLYNKFISKYLVNDDKKEFTNKELIIQFLEDL